MVGEVFLNFILLSVILTFVTSIRVCSNLFSYDNPLSKDCYDNPDGEGDINGIIRSWNFNATEYFVQTQDGYIISVVRAYNPNVNDSLRKRTPLVFAGGFLCNGNYWVAKGNKSLHYQLGSLGYETWSIHWRGTKASKRHVSLSSSDLRYWDFSFYEQGKYDLPAVLEKVKSVTGEKCVFVGHSTAASSVFILGSERPAYFNNLVKGCVAMSPTSVIGNLTGSIRVLIKTFPILQPIVDLTSHGEFLPFMASNLLHNVVAQSGLLMSTLQTLFYSAFGFDLDELDAPVLPVFTSIVRDSASMKNVVHLGQLAQSGRFQQYDYGAARNLIHYGSMSPPQINLAKFNIPTAFFVAQNDLAVTVGDANRLYGMLPPATRCGFNIIPYAKFNHLDYLEAKNVDLWLNNYLIVVLDGLSNSTCLST